MGTPEFVTEVSTIVLHLGEYKTSNYSPRIKRVKRDFFLVATKECTGGNYSNQWCPLAEERMTLLLGNLFIFI